MNWEKICVILTAILFAILVSIGLDSFPPPNRDEVSVAYNAWSIATTGRDEHGIYMPKSFLAFGDQKIPVYTYLTALLFKVFEPTIALTRLPSTLAGALTILTLWYLLKSLWPGSKYVFFRLASVGLAATAPVTIFYSRMAYEANLELPLVLLFLAWFIRGTTSKPYYLFLSLLPLNLAFYTYNTNIFLVPLLVITIYLSQKKTASKKQFLFFFLILIFSYFIYSRIFADGNSARQKATILDTGRITHEVDSDLRDMSTIPPFISRIFHNKIVHTLTYFQRNYFYTLTNVDFLYFYGDSHPWHKSAGIGRGNLYAIGFPFLIIGLIAAFFHLRHGRLLVAWWLISIIPSSLTWDTPVTTRLLLFLLFTTVITAYGWSYVTKIINWHLAKIGFFVSVLGLFAYAAGYYLLSYAAYFPKYLHSLWLPGMRELVAATTKAKADTNPDKIFVHAEDDAELSYIYFAFFTPFTPQELQERAVWTNTVFRRVGNFDRYYFHTLNNVKNDPLFVKDKEKYLYVGPWEKRPNDEILAIVKHAKGYPYWVITAFTKEDVI